MNLKVGQMVILHDWDYLLENFECKKDVVTALESVWFKVGGKTWIFSKYLWETEGKILGINTSTIHSNAVTIAVPAIKTTPIEFIKKIKRKKR